MQLWARDPALADDIAKRRINAVYLPDVPLPSAVTPVGSLAAALRDADFVVSAVPSHGCRGVMRDAAPLVPAQIGRASCRERV